MSLSVVYFTQLIQGGMHLHMGHGVLWRGREYKKRPYAAQDRFFWKRKDESSCEDDSGGGPKYGVFIPQIPSHAPLVAHLRVLVLGALPFIQLPLRFFAAIIAAQSPAASSRRATEVCSDILFRAAFV